MRAYSDESTDDSAGWDSEEVERLRTVREMRRHRMMTVFARRSVIKMRFRRLQKARQRRVDEEEADEEDFIIGCMTSRSSGTVISSD